MMAAADPKPSVRDLHLAHVRSVTDRMRRLGGDADRSEAKRNAGRPPGPGFPPFTNLEHNTDLWQHQRRLL